MKSNSFGAGASAQQFGGKWTTAKLEVLHDYLESYTTALKKFNFETCYIDAFAGSGYHQPTAALLDGELSLLGEPEPQAVLEGSARIALQTSNPFSRYVFVEKDASNCQKLHDLKGDFPGLASRIEIKNGDANQAIQEMCQEDWLAANRRGVLLLDPYGLQVEWKTVELVAATQAIDMWLLFPLSVTRLLVNSGEIPDAWRSRLNIFFGNEEWYAEFYKKRRVPIDDLFGDDTVEVVKASLQDIGDYFVRRLEGVFAGVAPPGVLRNTNQQPLFLFCYGIGNPRGKEIGLRIAKHLIKGIQ